MHGEDPRREAARIIATQSWFALSTVGADGLPAIGYIPYAGVDGAFGLVASRLAAHTANLLARRPASILLVDAAGDGDDPYSRARFSLHVAPRPAARGSASADAIWSALRDRQGATVALLRTLPDFEAIALEPLGGRLVMGFAASHDFDAAAIAEIVRRRPDAE